MQSIQLLAASLLLLVFLSAASDQRLRVTLFEESAVGTPVGTSLSNLLGASGGTGSGGGPSVPSCPGGSRRVFSFSSEPLNPFLTDRFSLSEAYALLSPPPPPPAVSVARVAVSATSAAHSIDLRIHNVRKHKTNTSRLLRANTVDCSLISLQRNVNILTIGSSEFIALAWA